MSERPARSSLFAELQRRNVHRAAIFYAGAAWLVVQVATQVFPFFHIAEWVVRWVVIAATVGFPLAMLFSWFYEWTPQGIKRESEIVRAESVTRATGKTLDKAIIAVLALAVLALLLNQFVLHRFTAGAAPVAAVAADKSIAVLPFENLSRDPDNAFFAAGIQDQVLAQLAKIGALRVISRTSTEQYAAKPASVADIARQLGVANVLEGSVQRAGDAVRVTVQLIRADGDSHLWAETYDRRLDNIFGVESEVAGAIAAALNAHLTGAEQQELAARPTHNTEAWEDYLRARVLYYRGEVEADVREEVRLAESAVRLDPAFAGAWAELAQAQASLVIGDVDTSSGRREAARQALQKAIELEPDLVEVRIAQGYYLYWVERDYERARLIFEAVRRRAPSNADIPFALALISRRQNRWDESLVHFGEAVALDPRNVEINSQAAETAFALRRYDVAEHYLAQLREVSPDNTRGLVEQMTLHQMRGQIDQAGTIAARLRVDATDLAGVLALSQQKLLERQYAAGAATMRQFIAALPAADPPNDGLYQYKLGQFLELAGDQAGAGSAYALARTRIGAKLAAQPDNELLLVAMALTEAALGHRDAALARIAHAEVLLPPGRDALRTTAHRLARVRIAVRFGDKDSALELLPTATRPPSSASYSDGPPLTAALLKLDPTWDSLRDDPRFQRLIAEGEAAERGPPTP